MKADTANNEVYRVITDIVCTYTTRFHQRTNFSTPFQLAIAVPNARHTPFLCVVSLVVLRLSSTAQTTYTDESQTPELNASVWAGQGETELTVSRVQIAAILKN